MDEIRNKLGKSRHEGRHLDTSAQGVIPELSDLVIEAPGPRRLVHALAYQAPLRFAHRALQVGTEVACARLADTVLRRKLLSSQVLSIEDGFAPAVTSGRRIALYLHYAPSGRVSAMVREQVRIYQASGFDVVFVTNAALLAAEDKAAAAAHSWKVIQRRNVGLDFGAWRDAAFALLIGRPPPDELLLVNDSVLGPISPLLPIFSAARNLKEGVVGLTESRQGGVHLQSYFVLALGAAAAADTLNFLTNLELSTSKWLMVQRGEFGLTRYLVRRGHRVTALFGYSRTLEAVLRCSEERRYVASLISQLSGKADDRQALRQALLQWPLNPTVHLWRGLPRCLSFPFIKTSVVRRNVGRLPGVANWPTLIGGEIECCADSVRDHLKVLNGP